MSLIKQPPISEKKLAAVRRNQKLSNGPVTAEGRERIRAAHLRHGFFAKDEEVALRALGEDPARFQELLEGLWVKYHPTDVLQEGLVIRLARALWLMNRADRSQEGYAVRQAQAVNIGREDRLHVKMMRLKITAEILQLLAQSVAGKHYVTTPSDLDMMKHLHEEGEVEEMGEFALTLFYQLQAPGTGKDGVDPQEKARQVANKIRAIFGVSTTSEFAPQGSVAADSSPTTKQDVARGVSPARADPSANSELALNEVNGQALKVGATQVAPNPYPKVSRAEWEARERPRRLLQHILARQAEICEAQRSAILKDSLTGPSRYERAAEVAPVHPNAPFLRRMQDAHFREVRRVTNLLLKIKRHERAMESLVAERGEPASHEPAPFSSDYVVDNETVS
jgi:hypothetical protein